MFCACAQSIAALDSLFAPLPANVAAMGNVSANAGAQSALSAAMSANTALAAALSASAVAGASVAFSASAMLSLAALANGLGALQGGLKMPLTRANCAPSLEQLANAITSQALFDALGGLPLDTLSPLQALAKLAGAMSAANALGVSLMAASASAQLSAMAQASTSAAASASGSGSGSASGSASAQASLNAAAFVAMSMAVQANLGIGIGMPGGVDLLGAKLEMLGGNLDALGALNDVLDAALLAKTLALLTALASINTSLGVNMLSAGAGYQVQPMLKSLSMAGGPGAMSLGLPSMSSSSSTSGSKSKSVSKAAQYAYQGGLGNLLSGLPVLPPATLLFAYLLGKLGPLGIGLVQHSACGPMCLIPPLPCPFGPADFAAQIASEGQKLQATKIAFEASVAPSAPAAAVSVATPAPVAAAKTALPGTESSGAGTAVKGKLDVKKPSFPKGPKGQGGSA